MWSPLQNPLSPEKLNATATVRTTATQDNSNILMSFT